MTPSAWEEDWQAVKKKPGELPTGLIVGSIEIADCYWNKQEDCFTSALENPKRLKTLLKPLNQAQPVFWRPQF